MLQPKIESATGLSDDEEFFVFVGQQKWTLVLRWTPEMRV